MHINDLEERRFLQDRIEGADETVQFTPEGKQSILDKVIQGEQWEKFLARKYVGTKRFGLDGGESDDPGAGSGDQIWRRRWASRRSSSAWPTAAASTSSPTSWASPIARSSTNSRAARPTRTMSAARATSNITSAPRTDREFDGIKVHLSLLPNPSHLEAVDPVVLGKARGGADAARATSEGDTVLPILLHGDAAFAGQGIVWECLGFSGLPGYAPAARIHFVINNQVGFTTSPQFARSSPYPSDVAKGVQAPILHVNGDDPEAVTFACKMAIEFRQKFDRDIVIDMWCYRRFGHNEGDEPSFTQPLMYAAIRKHPPISEIYGKRLIAEGVIDQAWVDEHDQRQFVQHLESEFEAATSYLPNKADWFEGRWAGLGTPGRAGARRAATSRPRIDDEMFDRLGRTLTTVPEASTIHKTLGRILDAKSRRCSRAARASTGRPPRRSPSAACCAEGYGVRLSGQDSGRGTFSQRHAVWVDQATGDKYIPLSTIEPRPLRGARQPAVRIRRARLRIWLFARRPEDAGAVGSAVRRLRQWRADDDRPVHRRGRGQVAARQRPRAAAAARLRRAGAGA